MKRPNRSPQSNRHHAGSQRENVIPSSRAAKQCFHITENASLYLNTPRSLLTIFLISLYFEIETFWRSCSTVSRTITTVLKRFNQHVKTPQTWCCCVTSHCFHCSLFHNTDSCSLVLLKQCVLSFVKFCIALLDTVSNFDYLWNLYSWRLNKLP